MSAEGHHCLLRLKKAFILYIPEDIILRDWRAVGKQGKEQDAGGTSNELCENNMFFRKL